MDIGIPLRDLGSIDSAALQELVLGIDESVWLENSYRQKSYDVHTQTHSLVMLFTDGEGWPNIEITKESAWELLVDEAMPIMHSILKEFYPPPSPYPPRAPQAKTLRISKEN